MLPSRYSGGYLPQAKLHTEVLKPNNDVMSVKTFLNLTSDLDMNKSMASAFLSMVYF